MINLGSHKGLSFISFAILLILVSFNAVSQNQTEIPQSKSVSSGNLQVGDLVRSLKFEKIYNGKGKSLKWESLSGKVIIVDFMATYCLSCIASLPKWDNMSKRFKDLEIVTVSHQSLKTISNFIQTSPSKQIKEYSLPIVVEDSLTSKLFPHRSIPHLVIIGKDNLVKAIVKDPELVTDSLIQKLVDRENISLPSSETDLEYNPSLSLTDQKSAREDVIYSFTIAKYKPGLSTIIGRTFTEDKQQFKIYGINNTILIAYRYAIFNGQSASNDFPNSRIIFEYKDSAKFLEPISGLDREVWSKNNLYCFELTAPSHQNGGEILKSLIEQHFKFKGSISKRKVRCLVIENVKKIDTTVQLNSIPRFIETNEYWTTENILWENLLYNINPRVKLPIVDESKFSGKLSIAFQPTFNDIDALISNLKRVGITSSVQEREIPMLIISEQY